MSFRLSDFDIQKFDAILEKGLSKGLGVRGEQVCIEAAICQTLGLPHGDDPHCVAEAVRNFKIALNDSDWSSPEARANGLRDLGLAQLGSLGVVDDEEFTQRLTEKIIRVLIPKLFRVVFPNNKVCLEAASNCERLGTVRMARGAAAWAAAEAMEEAARGAAAWAADAAADAAVWAAQEAADAATWTAWAAQAAQEAATRAAAKLIDTYLILSANLALETLRELKSPGIALLDKEHINGN